MLLTLNGPGVNYLNLPVLWIPHPSPLILISSLRRISFNHSPFIRAHFLKFLKPIEKCFIQVNQDNQAKMK